MDNTTKKLKKGDVIIKSKEEVFWNKVHTNTIADISEAENKLLFLRKVEWLAHEEEQKAIDTTR